MICGGLDRMSPTHWSICLNWRLDDVTLRPAMRQPFDVLAEGQGQSGGGDAEGDPRAGRLPGGPQEGRGRGGEAGTR